jgi:hypothetical protein
MGRAALCVRLNVQAMTLPSDMKTGLELIRVMPTLQPFLSPLPATLAWDGALVDKVPSMPETLLQQVAGQITRPRAIGRDLQQLEATEAFPTLLLAQGVA